MPRQPKPPPEPAAPVDSPRVPEPWERQPGETEKQWVAFIAYRDQTPGDRSLRLLAGDRPGKTREIERWSSKHRWVARVNAWDALADERTRQARLDAIDNMNARQQAVGAILMSKILQRVDAIDPSNLPPRSLAALITAAAKAEREALGVASSTTRHSLDAGSDDDGRPVELLEWLAGRIAGETPDEGGTE